MECRDMTLGGVVRERGFLSRLILPLGALGMGPRLGEIFVVVVVVFVVVGGMWSLLLSSVVRGRGRRSRRSFVVVRRRRCRWSFVVAFVVVIAGRWWSLS